MHRKLASDAQLLDLLRSSDVVQIVARREGEEIPAVGKEKPAAADK